MKESKIHVGIRTHNDDGQVSRCQRPIQFVIGRLWCKTVLTLTKIYEISIEIYLFRKFQMLDDKFFIKMVDTIGKQTIFLQTVVFFCNVTFIFNLLF